MRESEDNTVIVNEDKPDFYCDIILQGKLDIEKVIETDYSLAYFHTQPFWEHHVVVIPKKHIRSFNEVNREPQIEIIDLFEVVQQVSQLFELKYGGCQVNTNIGYLQSNRHLHIHIIAGKQLKTER